MVDWKEEGESEELEPCDRLVEGRLVLGGETRRRFTSIKSRGAKREAQEELWRLQRALNSARECVVILKTKTDWVRDLIIDETLHDLKGSALLWVFWLPHKLCKCRQVAVIATNEKEARERLLRASYGLPTWNVETGEDHHLALVGMHPIDSDASDGCEVVGLDMDGAL